MFNDSQIPSNEIMTRYIAPFGLTALLRPSKPGQSVDSFWVGSQGDSGRLYTVRRPAFAPPRRSNHAARPPHAAAIAECSIPTQRRLAAPGNGRNRRERSHRACRDRCSFESAYRDLSRRSYNGNTPMMRLLLCIGDEPETGGTIEPYSGASYLIRGHQIALIGASVHCNACNSSGPIVKAGGPRRPWHHGVEVAHEGDIVLCKCGQPPIMIATMQSTSRNDDMVESLGDVSDHHHATAQPGVGLVLFGQGFVLRDRQTERPLMHVQYRVRSSSGVISSGVTDARGRTARIETLRAQNVTIEIQH